MSKRIIYRHQMTREPTLDDRARRVGLFGFLEELQRNGWTDERFYAVREFRAIYESHIGQNKDTEQAAVLKTVSTQVTKNNPF